ncbi:MAG: hypothetical protein QOD08_1800 [Gaiellaceae bacterium]|nr:hypothetical protein [Gaiellaceae bacterium]
MKLAITALAAIGALATAGSAFAHAEVSPAVVLSRHGQEFSLIVPTEKENAKTTAVELTPPAAFSIDSFAPTPGWKRDVRSTGTGESAQIQKVTWSGGSVPHEEYAVFRFLAQPDSSGDFEFKVRQTYSDGTVVDWTGAESSDTPAPHVKAVSSLGGGGTSTLALIALVVAAAALLVAALGLVGGRRVLA